MQITRQADYAVRAVLYLSKIGEDRRAATSMIAQEQPRGGGRADLQVRREPLAQRRGRGA